MAHIIDHSSLPEPISTKASWRTYVLDWLQAPPRAKAALVGCVILMTLSPAGLSAMMPFITASFSAQTGRPMPEAIFLFVAMPLLISPIFLPIAGAWVDRWGAKRVAIPSSILYAAVTALVPLCSSISWILGVMIALASVFGFMASFAVVFKVITGWFPRHRGIGFALIGAASSLAGAFLSPVFLWMTGSPHSAPGSGLGWDGTYYVIAGFILALGVPAALFLLSEPDYVKAGSKLSKPPTKAELKKIPGLTLRNAIKNRTWFLIVLSLSLTATGPMAVRQNAVGFFGERGFDPSTIALSQSVLFIASIVGLFCGGMILDRSRRPWVVFPLLAAVPAGLLLSYVNHGNVALLFVANALLGFAMGSESSLGPFLIARYFGLKCFAQLQGLSMAISTVFLGLSPFVVSAMQTASGSYAVPLTVLITLGGLATLLALFLPNYPAEWSHLPSSADQAVRQ